MITEDGTVHIRNLRIQNIKEYNISFVARLTGADVKIPFLVPWKVKKGRSINININPYTYECTDFNNIYALGPLAGDRLVRFLQGGALAIAASLFKKRCQTSFTNECSVVPASRMKSII